MTRQDNLVPAMARLCNFLQTRIIEDPLGITEKIRMPGFAVEESRHARALAKAQ